jgi:hypothetical protein
VGRVDFNRDLRIFKKQIVRRADWRYWVIEYFLVKLRRNLYLYAVTDEFAAAGVEYYYPILNIAMAQPDACSKLGLANKLM